MGILAGELVPEEEHVLASGLYRKQLALGLFYKVNNEYKEDGLATSPRTILQGKQ